MGISIAECRQDDINVTALLRRYNSVTIFWFENWKTNEKKRNVHISLFAVCVALRAMWMPHRCFGEKKKTANAKAKK